jgi:hypothetical protein
MKKRKVLFRSHWWKYYCGTKILGIALCSDSNGQWTKCYSFVFFGFEACLYIERMPKKEPCNGNCGMNYCDENGCTERKRVLTEIPIQNK